MVETPKLCQSCGEEVMGKFCHHCGEKVELGRDELKFRHFVKETFEEVSNLDSTFLVTMKYLITRPGFLTTEVLAGKTTPYIKPLRLYITLVVFHFLVFSLIKSGDFFDVSRFPIFTNSAYLENVILEQEEQSAKSVEEFKAELNQHLKDNLNIILYFLVFLIAWLLKFLYPGSNRYYIEHLYFALHLFCFGFVRNILLIPIIMLNWMTLALILAGGTQLVYVFLAVKRVYPQSFFLVVIKTIGVLIIFMVCLITSVIGSFYIGIYQVNGSF